NLTLNARDAMPHGGRLEIRTEMSDRARNLHGDAIEGRFVKLARSPQALWSRRCERSWPSP
ncbi:MAG: hypothetical protein ACE5GX_18580, partial [Thermoanaerobaculia bacterium]